VLHAPLLKRAPQAQAREGGANLTLCKNIAKASGRKVEPKDPPGERKIGSWRV
jgi:hypothetical protein